MMPTGDGQDEDAMRQELRRLYEDLRDAIASHAPVCRVSGRCCRFVEYDHVLFLTEPECDLLVSEGPPPVRPLDEGATCPWQDDGGRCTAREARPLGCRLYYCDPAFETAMHVLAETFVARLKAIHHAHGRAWSYAPLHHHLTNAVEAGRWSGTTSQTSPEDRLNT